MNNTRRQKIEAIKGRLSEILTINKNEFVLGFYPFCLQIRWGY